MQLVIVSGLSGSGKSVALDTLEDFGAHCVDNMPPTLLLEYVESLMQLDSHYPKQAAIGMDARALPKDLDRFPSILEQIRKLPCDITVMFLDSDEDTLIRRFSDTRRRHPLADRVPTLREAVRQERECLAAIANLADLRLDTSRTNVHELRTLLRQRLKLDRAPLSVLLQSFAYRSGVPSDSDFVFDSRCLPNPHWVDELRTLNGTDPAVCDYLSKQPQAAAMLEDLKKFLDHWIPSFVEAGRHYLNISIGCTGGQHRSVYLVEQLAELLSDSATLQITVLHRDMEAQP